MSRTDYAKIQNLLFVIFGENAETILRQNRTLKYSQEKAQCIYVFEKYLNMRNNQNALKRF